MDVLSVLDAAVDYRRRLDMPFVLAPIQSRRMRYVTYPCRRCGEPVLLVVHGGEVVTPFDCEEYRQLLADELMLHNLPSYVLSEAQGDPDDPASVSTLCQIWPTMGRLGTIGPVAWNRLLEEQTARHCGLLLEAGESEESEGRDDASPTT